MVVVVTGRLVLIHHHGARVVGCVVPGLNTGLLTLVMVSLCPRELLWGVILLYLRLLMNVVRLARHVHVWMSAVLIHLCHVIEHAGRVPSTVVSWLVVVLLLLAAVESGTEALLW